MNNYDFAEDEIEVIDADSNQPTAISPKAPTPDPSTTSTPLSEPLRDLPSQEGNEKDEFAQLIKSNPQQAIDNVLKSIKPDAMQSQVIEAINPVIDLIQSGSNYEEVMENLIDVFPEMNADDLEDTLTKLNFIAEVWGRISNDAIA